jgi:sRNA-binding carbon storage regulator CsrA
MLILSRNLSQEIIITSPLGEKIVIKVSKLNMFTAELGITAPSTFKILRAELEDA